MKGKIIREASGCQDKLRKTVTEKFHRKSATFYPTEKRKTSFPLSRELRICVACGNFIFTKKKVALIKLHDALLCAQATGEWKSVISESDCVYLASQTIISRKTSFIANWRQAVSSLRYNTFEHNFVEVLLTFEVIQYVPQVFFLVFTSLLKQTIIDEVFI